MPARRSATRKKTTTKARKWVYVFVDGKAEGDAKMRALLGGKGAGIAEMTNVGMPVPPGFTITTQACNAYFASGKKLPPGLWDQVLKALARVESSTGKKLGDTTNPAPRLGPPTVRPVDAGMMDTVLTFLVSHDDETRTALEKLTKNTFRVGCIPSIHIAVGRIVLGIRGASSTDPEEKGPFEIALEEKKTATGAKTDADLKPDALRQLVDEYKKIVRKETKKDFPTDVNEQLRLAIQAVFDSWFGKRAHDYREFNKIPHDLGTAVNVVTMVFGNMGDDSGTGVAFTRDPNTGARELYGEYRVNAQG